MFKLVGFMTVFLVATTLHAGVGETLYRSDLSFEFHEQFQTAQITIDRIENKVKLDLFENNECQGENCSQELATSLDLAIVEQSNLPCGGKKIRALVDNMPLDGTREALVILDFSEDFCGFNLLPATTVLYEQTYYDRINAGLVSNEYVLSGSPLRSLAFYGQLAGVKFSGATLRLDLNYAGGCKDHAFNLHWGDCQLTTIFNSEVKQCDVEILHAQGSDDLCERWVEDTVELTIDRDAAYLLNFEDGTQVLVH